MYNNMKKKLKAYKCESQNAILIPYSLGVFIIFCGLVCNNPFILQNQQDKIKKPTMRADRRDEAEIGTT